jgi:hypothetical protein
MDKDFYRGIKVMNDKDVTERFPLRQAPEPRVTIYFAGRNEIKKRKKYAGAGNFGVLFGSSGPCEGDYEGYGL